MMAKYGKFKNVNNYIALVGKKESSLEETCGYYGEKIVLKAQQLGSVKATALFGPNSKIDLGIVKYHFEVGADGGNWQWGD